MKRDIRQRLLSLFMALLILGEIIMPQIGYAVSIRQGQKESNTIVRDKGGGELPTSPGQGDQKTQTNPEDLDPRDQEKNAEEELKDQGPSQDKASSEEKQASNTIDIIEENHRANTKEKRQKEGLDQELEDLHPNIEETSRDLNYYQSIGIHLQDQEGQDIKGVSFALYDSLENLIGQEQTDSRGQVFFKDLEPGTYKLYQLGEEDEKDPSKEWTITISQNRPPSYRKTDIYREGESLDSYISLGQTDLVRLSPQGQVYLNFKLSIDKQVQKGDYLSISIDPDLTIQGAMAIQKDGQVLGQADYQGSNNLTYYFNQALEKDQLIDIYLCLDTSDHGQAMELEDRRSQNTESQDNSTGNNKAIEEKTSYKQNIGDQEVTTSLDQASRQENGLEVEIQTQPIDQYQADLAIYLVDYGLEEEKEEKEKNTSKDYKDLSNKTHDQIRGIEDRQGKEENQPSINDNRSNIASPSLLKGIEEITDIDKKLIDQLKDYIQENPGQDQIRTIGDQEIQDLNNIDNNISSNDQLELEGNSSQGQDKLSTEKSDLTDGEKETKLASIEDQAIKEEVQGLIDDLSQEELSPNSGLLDIEGLELGPTLMEEALGSGPASGSLKIIKTDIETGERLEGVIFTLTRDGSTSATASLVAETNANGEASYPIIPQGSYTLKETKAKEGYNENPTSWKVVVDSQGNTWVEGTNLGGAPAQTSYSTGWIDHSYGSDIETRSKTDVDLNSKTFTYQVHVNPNKNRITGSYPKLNLYDYDVIAYSKHYSVQNYGHGFSDIKPGKFSGIDTVKVYEVQNGAKGNEVRPKGKSDQSNLAPPQSGKSYYEVEFNGRDFNALIENNRKDYIVEVQGRIPSGNQLDLSHKFYKARTANTHNGFATGGSASSDDFITGVSNIILPSGPTGPVQEPTLRVQNSKKPVAPSTPSDFPLVFKVQNKEGQALDGASFILKGTDGIQYAGTSNSLGVINFSRVKPGSYTIENTSAPTGYDKKSKITLNVSIDQESGKPTGSWTNIDGVSFKIQGDALEGTIILDKSQPQEEGVPYKVVLKDNENNQPLAGVTVSLVGTSSGGKTYTAKTNSQGIADLGLVEPGSYTLYHNRVDGYLDFPPVELTFKYSNGNWSVSSAGLPASHSDRHTAKIVQSATSLYGQSEIRLVKGENPSQPEVPVKLKITDKTGRTALAGADFQIIGPGISRIGKSDANGFINFGTLPAGDYTITNLSAPQGYGKENSYQLKIERYGLIGLTWKATVKQDQTLNPNSVEINPNNIAQSFTIGIKLPDESDPVLGQKGKLTLYPRDLGNSELLYSGTFKLEGPEGYSKETSVDGQGKIVFEDLKEGTYTLTQTSAKEGYQAISESLNFTVDNLGRTSISGQGIRIVQSGRDTHINIYNRDTRPPNLTGPGKLKVRIKDQNGNPLQGVAYGIFRHHLVEGHGHVQNAYSDQNGEILFENLPPGTYDLKEVIEPQGFNRLFAIHQFSQDESGKMELTKQAKGYQSHRFDANTNTLTVNLVYDNSQPVQYQPARLEILKTDDSDQALPGAEFWLYSLDNSLTSERKVSGTDGKLAFDNLWPGSYRLEESLVPKGYEKVDNQALDIQVSAEGQVFIGTNSQAQGNTPYQIKNKKASGASFILANEYKGGGILAGANFVLTDSTGNTKTYTIGPNGQVEVTGLAPGTYTLQQVDGAKGFAKASETWTIEVSNDLETKLVGQPGEATKLFPENQADNAFVKLTVINDLGYEFTANKVDEDGKALEGAVFTLTHPGGFTEEKTSDQEGKAIFTGLTPGEYSLVEKQAPYGYIKDDKTYNFTIKDPDQVQPGESTVVVPTPDPLDRAPMNVNHILKDHMTDFKSWVEKVDESQTPQYNILHPYGLDILKYSFKQKVPRGVRSGDFFTVQLDNKLLPIGIEYQPGLDYPHIYDSRGDIIAYSSYDDDSKTMTYTFTDYVDSREVYFTLESIAQVDRSVVRHNSSHTMKIKVHGVDQTLVFDTKGGGKTDKLNVEYGINPYHDTGVAFENVITNRDTKKNTITIMTYVGRNNIEKYPTRDQHGIPTRGGNLLQRNARLIYFNYDLDNPSFAPGGPFDLADAQVTVYKALDGGANWNTKKNGAEANFDPDHTNYTKLLPASMGITDSEFNDTSRYENVTRNIKITPTKLSNNRQKLQVDIKDLPNYNNYIVKLEIKYNPNAQIQYHYIHGLLRDELLYQYYRDKSDENYGLARANRSSYLSPGDGKSSGTAQDFGTLTIYKVDENQKPMPGAAFMLTGPDGYRSIKGPSGENGLLEFTELPRGTYKLKEIVTPKGYVGLDKEVTVQVDGPSVTIEDGGENVSSRPDGSFSVINKKEAQPEEGELRIVNKKEDKPTTGLKFRKVDEQGQGLSGAVFELTEQGTGRTITKTSDQNGWMNFENLQEGEFTIREVSPPEGYQRLEKIDWKIKVEKNRFDNSKLWVILTSPANLDGSISIVGVDSLQANMSYAGVSQVVIKNKKIQDIKGEFSFNKTDGAGNGLGGAAFQMTRHPASETGRNIWEATSSQDGSISFQDLEPGVYVLEEVSPPEGYQKTYQRWEVIIGQDGQAGWKVLGENAELSSENKITDHSKEDLSVKNDKIEIIEGKGSLNIKKTIMEKGSPLKDAEFTLYKRSDYENLADFTASDVYKRYKSTDAGEIKITEIPPGTYTLAETKAPDGYTKTDRTWTVEVRSTGYTTISLNPRPEDIQPETGRTAKDVKDLVTANGSFTGKLNTTIHPTVIYPNDADGMRVSWDLTFKPGIQKGDYFILKYSESLDPFGIRESSDHYLESSTGEIIAHGVWDEANNQFKFTFTDYLEGRDNAHATYSHPVYIDPYIVRPRGNYLAVSNVPASLTLAGETISSNVNVNYRTHGAGNTNLDSSINAKIVEENRKENTFTQYIYVNPFRNFSSRTSHRLQLDVYNYNIEGGQAHQSNAQFDPRDTTVDIYRYDGQGYMPPSFGIKDNELNSNLYTKVETIKPHFTQEGTYGNKISMNFGAIDRPYLVIVKGQIRDIADGLEATAMATTFQRVSYRYYNRIYYDERETSNVFYKNFTRMEGVSSEGSGETIYTTPEITVPNKQNPVPGDFEILKKADSLSGEILQGAVFTLYKDANATEPVKITKDQATGKLTIVEDGTGQDYVETTDDTGKAVFTGLPQGTYYLKETKAPKGYVANFNALWKVEVDIDGKVTISDSTITEENPDGSLDKTLYEVRLASSETGQNENTQLTLVNKAAFYPNTGGRGTFIFSVLGTGLMALAAHYIIRAKKKARDASQ